MQHGTHFLKTTSKLQMGKLLAIFHVQIIYSPLPHILNFLHLTCGIYCILSIRGIFQLWLKCYLKCEYRICFPTIKYNVLYFLFLNSYQWYVHAFYSMVIPLLLYIATLSLYIYIFIYYLRYTWVIMYQGV